MNLKILGKEIMEEEDIVKHYFDISNNSNFVEIAKVFTERTTYSSENTGLYLGVKEILKMQKSFHESFNKLHWNINEIKIIKPGIYVVDFTFLGEKINDEQIMFSGLEYIVIYKGKIQHIEIKNK